MFDLQDVHARLSGSRALFCREPLEAGLDKLERKLSGDTIAVFDHITQFDYDGVLTKIQQVEGFSNLSDAEAYAIVRSRELTAPYATDTCWKTAPRQVREANVLPATGYLMPGWVPLQFSCEAFRRSEYDTAYLRLYVVDLSDGVDL